MYEIFWILKIELLKNQNSGFWIPTETKQALSLAVLFCTLSVKVRILSGSVLKKILSLSHVKAQVYR